MYSVNLGKYFGLVILVISCYILWQVRRLILLIFTALILADMLDILVRKFQEWSEYIAALFFSKNWRIKRSYAVLFSLIFFFAVLAGLWVTIIPPFVQQIQELLELFPEGMNQLIGLIDAVKTQLPSGLRESLPDLEDLLEELQPLVNALVNRGWSFFSSGIGIVLNLLLLLALTLMLLADPYPYRRGFIRLFPSFYRRRVDRIITLCDENLESWLLGMLFNMVTVTILTFIALVILGIPLALAQAMLAGLLTFIPHIGPTISVVSPMIISLVEQPWNALFVLIIYTMIYQIEGNLITPLVISEQVLLLPAVTLLSQLIFASFFGFLGLFLALPLTVIAQSILKEVLLKDILDKWQNKTPNLEA